MLTKKKYKIDLWITRLLVPNGLVIYATWLTAATHINLGIVLQYFANVSATMQLLGLSCSGCYQYTYYQLPLLGLSCCGCYQYLLSATNYWGCHAVAAISTYYQLPLLGQSCCGCYQYLLSATTTGAVMLWLLSVLTISYHYWGSHAVAAISTYYQLPLLGQSCCGCYQYLLSATTILGLSCCGCYQYLLSATTTGAVMLWLLSVLTISYQLLGQSCCGCYQYLLSATTTGAVMLWLLSVLTISYHYWGSHAVVAISTYYQLPLLGLSCCGCYQYLLSATTTGAVMLWLLSVLTISYHYWGSHAVAAISTYYQLPTTGAVMLWLLSVLTISYHYWGCHAVAAISTYYQLPTTGAVMLSGCYQYSW